MSVSPWKEAGQIGGLDILITVRDRFLQPKNDRDADKKLIAYLEYFANLKDDDTGNPLIQVGPGWN